MTAETGQLALIIAFLLAIVQSTVPLIGVRTGNVRWMRLAEGTAIGQLMFVATAFIALTMAFVQSDFSLQLVALNSHTAKPLVYKISGVWGNHEGSILLWTLILTLYGAAVPLFGKALPRGLRTRALAVQGMIGAGFLGFILFTSNPFLRLDPAPMNGSGMNPLLQDPGLAVHPPFLYLGYVGFSMSFSFAVAALLEGRVDALWAKWLKPWVLAAWSFLTIGIMLGSVWAYYELGWGGWWFWDPVENASLMPWIAGTALLHSTLVVERRYTLVNWTVLLAILTFSLSLIGTFLVRSGVITSVHAFATDPDRGVYILVLLALASGGALTIYSLRAHKLRASNGFDFISREAGLVWNNILLVCAAAIVFLGTFYPLLIEVISNGQDKISVGPPFFNLYFGVLMTILIVFMGVAPLLKWRQDTLRKAARPLIFMASAAIIIAVLTALLGKTVLGGAGLALSAWLIIGTLWSLARKTRLGRVAGKESWRLWKNQPAGFHAFVLAHIGLGITTMGVTGMSVWAQEKFQLMQVGEQAQLAGYEVKFTNLDETTGPNYRAQVAHFDISRKGHTLGPLVSERRFYPVRGMQTTEAGIRVRPGNNFYVAVGDGDNKDGWAVRMYYHPLVNWIWIGAILMGLGGFTAMRDRRSKQPDPAAEHAPLAGEGETA